LLVCLAWVFFRADTLSEAGTYISGMFQFHEMSLNLFLKNGKYVLFSGICFISVSFLLYTEWQHIKTSRAEIQLSKVSLLLLLGMIFFMGAFKNQMSFIYFQF